MTRIGALAVLAALVVAAIIAAIRKMPAASGAKRVEHVRISTVDRRFASAVTVPRDRAGHVLALDRWLVRYYGGGWRVVFVGSDAPPCEVAPAAVRRDLLGSVACFKS